jgi:hypothetical protein
VHLNSRSTTKWSKMMGRVARNATHSGESTNHRGVRARRRHPTNKRYIVDLGNALWLTHTIEAGSNRVEHPITDLARLYSAVSGCRRSRRRS